MNAKINTRLFPTAFFEANNGTAYHKALAQFEKPLLQEVMTECRGNQTKAAEDRVAMHCAWSFKG
ncbi:MAG: hypothetical protein H9855_13995 [Candidatus Acinetobacter avistercoris]|nr:hypothetical protein [Candidatus Acinetobacter avistercoris]